MLLPWSSFRRLGLGPGRMSSRRHSLATAARYGNRFLSRWCAVPWGRRRIQQRQSPGRRLSEDSRRTAAADGTTRLSSPLRRPGGVAAVPARVRAMRRAARLSDPVTIAGIHPE